MKGSRKRVAVLVGISLILILALLPVASSLVQAAIPWTKLGGLTLSELYVVDTCVVKNSPTDYEMWYTHGKTALSLTEIASNLNSILTDNIVSDILNQDIDALLTHLATELDVAALWSFLGDISTVVGYATSSDGINWNMQNSEVLAGSGGGGWDSVGLPSVIKNSATDYEMWYTHASTSMTQLELQNIVDDLDGTPAERRDALLALMNSTTSAIGYTTSTDGETWTGITPGVFTGNGSGGIWDSVAAPSVINDGGTYKMWYTHVKTDLVVADLDAILADLPAFGADDLFNILDGISSVIGYTTSPDGTTWATGTEVLAGGGGIWDSVAFPSVVKRGGSYEMWYARGTTDLTLAEFNTLQTEVLALKPDLSTLWADIQAANLTQFLADLDSLLSGSKLDTIKTLLANSSGVVGHAVSSDGVSWQVQEQPAMVGVTGSPWSSVGASCVIYSNGVYEMWYVKGIADLDAQLIVELIDGTTLPIAYATFPGNSVGLVSEWNFVGLPISPVSPTITDVLAGIIGDVEIVWYFDGATDTWYYYIPGGPATLTQMTEGKGYWVKNTNPSTLGVTGIEPPLPYDIPLVVDWNLISLPETPSPSAIGDVLAGIIGDVEIVWYFDGATDTWYYYIPGGPATLTQMTEGKAYWIKMAAPNTLTIN